jgi:excisionase family DNA binding protein
MATKQMATLTQVANYLKVHKSTVYRLVRRKELPAFKVWHDWRFDLRLIDDWRVAQEQAAKASRRPTPTRAWKNKAGAPSLDLSGI